MLTYLLHPSRVVHGLMRRGRFIVATKYLTARMFLNNDPLWIDLGGIKIPITGDGDLQEVNYYLDGRNWWIDEIASLRRYVQDGDVAVDVGANIGFMSGVLSTLTGMTGRVYSFEPSPSTYGKLLNVIQMNGFSNVVAQNLGCGSEDRSVTLYSAEASGHATIRPTQSMESSNYPKQTVRIVKLDDFLRPLLNRLDFIKIDTEGYEDEVLIGASAIIEQFRPVIYIELSAEYGVSSQNAVRILKELGYSFDREPEFEKIKFVQNFFALPPAKPVRRSLS